MLLQPIENATVTTRIIEIETSVSIDSCIDLPTINDPQKLGSAITYYRRYTLQSLLGLLAQDDDGNGAVKQIKEERKQSLLESQYHNLLLPENKDHIQTYLDKCKMSGPQRKELQSLIK